MIYPGPRLSAHECATRVERVAWHEAAHAAMTLRLNRFVGCARIVADWPIGGIEDWRGFVRGASPLQQVRNYEIVPRVIKPSERFAVHYAMWIQAAGPVAEYIAGLRPNPESDALHFGSVRQAAKLLHPSSDSAAHRLAHEMFAEAYFILARWEWPAVRAIAAALLKYRHLTAHQLHELYERALGRKSRSPVIECEGVDGKPCDRPEYLAVSA